MIQPLKIKFLLFIVVILFGCGSGNDEHAIKEKDEHTMDKKEEHGMKKKEEHAMNQTKNAEGEMRMTKAIQLSDQQIQLGNIGTDSLREHALGGEISVTGSLQANKNKVITISSRIMGRIEKLHFKSIGEEIKKGQILYEIFSEELMIAIKELILALEKKETGAITSDNFIHAARNKLLLYGLTIDQIEKLIQNKQTPQQIAVLSPEEGIISSVNIKEGDYVMLGQTVFQLHNLSSLWFEGQIYRNDIPSVKEGVKASVVIPGFSVSGINGKVSFINPEISSNPAVQLIRIEISNPEKKLKPGMQANAALIPEKSSVLALPVDAVILDEFGAMVWVKAGQNMFEMRMVETGMETDDFIEIKKGVKKGEQVVVSGAYLLTSEYAFKMGAGMMHEH